MQASKERFHISARNVRSFRGFNAKDYEKLSALGISLSRYANAMDSLQPLSTTAAIPGLIQFFQKFLPGLVIELTAARKIDDLVGVTTVGEWRDEQIVQAFLELTGYAQPYSDYSNIPLSSWNLNFANRTIVRFEEGMQVSLLESERASAVNVDSGAMKREAAATALEILRNMIGFYGYNSGNNNTYGFLNDPNLPNYVNVPNGVSGYPQWSKKTILEIIADLLLGFITLQNNSKDVIDPETTRITIALPTASAGYLGTVSEFGYSVRSWLRETYPNTRIVTAPELNAANGGANVFYMFAEALNNDPSTDDKRVFVQAVPTKFKVCGVEQRAKSYLEDYSNATAGVLCKRPWAIVRYSGI